MITVGISVPQANAEVWLERIANLETLRDVELSAADIDEMRRLARRAERLGLHVPFARDLLPVELGRYLDELGPEARTELGAALGERLACCRELGATFISVGVGLDQVRADRAECAIRTRAALLRQVIPKADVHGASVCFPVRFPLAFPQSREWELATNVVHELMAPGCRLGVCVFPAELGSSFDVSRFLRSHGLQIGLIRFCYEPALGEALVPDELRGWARTLKRYGFRGGILLAPCGVAEDGIAAATRQTDGWGGTLLTALRGEEG